MTRNRENSLLDVFDNGNALKFITPKQLEHIDSIQYTVSFNKGENIFKQGAPMPHLIILRTGLAKVFIEDGNSNNIILRLVKAGQLVGGPGFFTDNRHHFTLTALENTVAHFIDATEFKNLILNNSKFALELIAYLNKTHIALYDKLRIISNRHMNGRIANTLLYLSNSVYDSDSFDTPLTRQDIADMSAMTKESAIRILKEFKSAGIISCSNNHFDIHRKESLLSLVQNG